MKLFFACRCLLPACLSLAALTAQAAESVLRLGNGSEPATLDPHRAEGVSDGNILRDLYEGLTSISPRGEVIPGAAQSWEVSDDALDYTFALRPTARWSNGDAVTADDFVAGLRRSVDPATRSAYSEVLLPIDGAAEIIAGHAPPARLAVSAPDAQTLRIHLRAPTPYFPGLLSHWTTFPVHRPSLARYGDAFARPGQLVSNGAYTLTAWATQAQVVAERNRYYWNNAATQIDRVVYLPTEDLNSELKRYRAGELDATYDIPLVQAGWIREHLGAQLHHAPYAASYYYGFNLAQPPFAGNPKLREALALAVDRDLIVNKVMHGIGVPAYGWIPPGISNYTPQKPAWAAWTRARRIAEAQRLYAQAGYTAEHPARIELRYNTHDDHRRIALVIAAMWKQYLGVQTQLINEEYKVFIDHRKGRRLTQLFRSSWIADFDDAAGFAEILRSTHGRNDESYSNPAYDQLLAQAAAEPDAARRRGLLEQAERLVLTDWPVLPIYFYESKHLVQPYVQGWRDNMLDYHYAKDLRLAQTRP